MSTDKDKNDGSSDSDSSMCWDTESVAIMDDFREKFPKRGRDMDATANNIIHLSKYINKSIVPLLQELSNVVRGVPSVPSVDAKKLESLVKRIAKPLRTCVRIEYKTPWRQTTGNVPTESLQKIMSKLNWDAAIARNIDGQIRRQGRENMSPTLPAQYANGYRQ